MATKKHDDLMAGVTAEFFTVPEFCAAHRISRSLFYKLSKAGEGPRVTKVGRATRITPAAAAEWRNSI